MKTRFDELLPFYVNGTLDEGERAWCDAYMREHADAAAELAWARSLQQRVKEDVPAASSEVGLDRAMQRIRAERAPARAGKVPQAAPASLLDKIRSGLAALLPQAALRPALAGALALVAVQAVVILQMATTPSIDDATQIRAVPPVSAIDPGPYLKVNFKGEAREADIRLLLVEVRGSLVAGPGQLGDYYVQVTPGQITAMTARLQASTIVDAVTPVDALPPSPWR
jgi:hypothetical protein